MLLKVSKNQIQKKKNQKRKKIKCYFTNKSKINKDSFTLKNHLKKKVNEKIVLNFKIISKCINVNC